MSCSLYWKHEGNEDTKSNDQAWVSLLPFEETFIVLNCTNPMFECFFTCYRVTDSEVKSPSGQQPSVQYKSQTQTVIIQQDIDAMYDVVHEDLSKTSRPPPTSQGDPQVGYDVLHSTVNKAEAAETQPQQALPTAEYAVINKTYIAAKAKKPICEQSSNAKSEPVSKQKKGKKKKSQQEQFEEPPPIPPQMYQYEEELLPSQAQVQQTNQSDGANAPSAPDNQNFSYPDSTYDVVTH